PAAAAAPPPLAPGTEQELEPLADEPELELELDTSDRSRHPSPVEMLAEAELEPEPEELPAIEEDEPLVEARPRPVAKARPPARPAQGNEAFASDLAEADFYIESGLTDEARAILDAILLGHPQHKGALNRLQRIGGPKAGRAA